MKIICEECGCIHQFDEADLVFHGEMGMTEVTCERDLHAPDDCSECGATLRAYFAYQPAVDTVFVELPERCPDCGRGLECVQYAIGYGEYEDPEIDETVTVCCPHCGGEISDAPGLNFRFGISRRALDRGRDADGLEGATL